MVIRYGREFLLSFADSEQCQPPPSDLDPAVRRDSPSPELVDSGVSSGSRFLHRRDRDYSHDLPEWRNKNSVNGGGLLSQQGPTRRKAYDEDGTPVQTSSFRVGGPGRQGTQARWDHRSSIDWERERGGRHWDGAEHDGLLGSGGGLRGAYPGGPDRFAGGGRGRNNSGDSRLNRSTGGYRNDFDAIDGETFGEKNSTEGREEEERKRRESFESMRKEQQRQKEEKKRQDENKHESESKVPSVDQIGSGVSNTKQEPRPLVPPGFGLKPSSKKEQNNGKVPVKEEKTISDDSKKSSDAVDPLTIACSTISLTEVEAFALSNESSTRKLSNTAADPGVPSSSPQTEKADARLTRTSSKFAHLFSVEDEHSPVDLLSLFGSSAGASKDGGNSPRSPVLKISEMKPSSEVLQHGPMLPMPVGPSLEDIEKAFDNGGEPINHGNTTQTFLTCEDIEQSLLAEAKSERRKGQPTRLRDERWKDTEAKEADTDVSRHLLSLLQKATVKPENEHTMNKVEDGRHEAKDGTETGAATLEALFGKSFMMELRSTDAPLSSKVASETNNHLFPNNAPPEVLDAKYVSRPSWRQEAPPQHPPLSDASAGPEVSADAKKPPEEIDGVVLSDFLRFKKAMKRNDVNDPFLDGFPENVSHEQPENSDRYHGTAAAPANLYRSHSPPLINQKSSSLHLQQLQQALSLQGSRSSIQAKQQQQQQQLMNGDLSSGYSRPARPSFSRLQQQAILEQQQHQHQHQLQASHFQGFPPPQSSAPFGSQDHHHLLYSSKQQQQQQQRPQGFFPTNGSNQQLPPSLAGLHLPPGLPMNFGHLHPSLATPSGFLGFPHPNEAAGFHGGEGPMSAPGDGGGGGGLESRWRDHQLALYHQQQQQHQRQQQFGAHVVGFQ